MHALPKANPVCEQIPASRIIIPELLGKLVGDAFTGYLSYTAGAVEVSCIFSKGRLTCAASTENRVVTSGLEAVTGLFDRIRSGIGQVSIYRMTSELAMCSHALLRGAKIISGVEVAKTDLGRVLSQLKSSRLNGVARFFTDDRQAMIFFSDGRPLGFYHDGARTIDTAPDESRRIAALPGARLEVFATKPLEELMRLDLLSRLPPAIPGETVQTPEALSGTAPASASEPPQEKRQQQEKLALLLEDLQEVAMAYLSREGRKIILSRLEEAGGIEILLDAAKTAGFLGLVEQDALLLDTPEHVDVMIALMKTEIAGLQAA
jgi:hypothetical protein